MFGPVQWVFAGGLDWVTRWIYGPLLRLAINWRYITVALAAAVFAITLAYVMSGRMGFGLFLNIRLAFWVAVGIPTAFMGAMLLLPTAGISINLVSMFAFIVALGIVVDDAIVVGENIYEYRQKGMKFIEAAIRGPMPSGARSARCR